MIEAVALILARKEEGQVRILIIQEKNSAPWKDRGDFSIPMETRNPGEDSVSAVHRCISEEANGILEWRILGIIGTFPVLDIAEATCFLIAVYNHCSFSDCEDVWNHRWLNPEEALQLKLRSGAREMIEKFMQLMHKYGLS